MNHYQIIVFSLLRVPKFGNDIKSEFLEKLIHTNKFIFIVASSLCKMALKGRPLVQLNGIRVMTSNWITHIVNFTWFLCVHPMDESARSKISRGHPVSVSCSHGPNHIKFRLTHNTTIHYRASWIHGHIHRSEVNARAALLRFFTDSDLLPTNHLYSSLTIPSNINIRPWNSHHPNIHSWTLLNLFIFDSIPLAPLTHPSTQLYNHICRFLHKGTQAFLTNHLLHSQRTLFPTIPRLNSQFLASISVVNYPLYQFLRFGRNHFLPCLPPLSHNVATFSVIPDTFSH
jgi:hypothetical protein